MILSNVQKLVEQMHIYGFKSQFIVNEGQLGAKTGAG